MAINLAVTEMLLVFKVDKDFIIAPVPFGPCISTQASFSASV